MLEYLSNQQKRSQILQDIKNDNAGETGQADDYQVEQFKRLFNNTIESHERDMVGMESMKMKLKMKDLIDQNINSI